MRVVAGTLGGRRLRAPPGRRTRPTPERVREAVFSTLGDRVPGASVLDLFAGSGALGIEALSRGATAAVFVERDRRAVAVLRGNLAALGLDGEVHAADAARFVDRSVAAGCPTVFDLVLCDPPYDQPIATLSGLLGRLADGGCLAAGALVVVERARQTPDPPDVAGLAPVARRDYGDTVVHHLRWAPPPARGAVTAEPRAAADEARVDPIGVGDAVTVEPDATRGRT